ncbi:MAG: glycoside hydrolase family 28 protein [Clostridia bacterium]|nr:glycoside hydrolase family 28 protein [Clostridia bacterium]
MINCIPYREKLVLYWELPDAYEDGSRYIIQVDDREVADTYKCHYELTGLVPNTKYSVFVFMRSKSGREVLVGAKQCTTEREKNRIDVTAAPYFAVGDGATLNTKALQRALDDCTKDDYVYLPEGDFMTGSLFLHSDTELYLERGAVLHGTECVKDYEPKIKSRFEGIEMMCYAALLNVGRLDRNAGCTCERVKIWGEGCVHGGGRTLAENVIEVERVLLADYIKSLGDKVKECENSMTIPGRPRPRLINMSCARDVVISGIGIMHGASWNVHMIYSDNIVTHGCTFRSENVWNGDGWDPDSSTNCTLFDCEFFTGDDAVAIKSGKNPEGNIIARPTEHIRVFDCVSHFGHGITVGSEMSGGVSDVRIWNCDMANSLYGVEIKATKKRGGYVRDVHVSYCSLARVLMHSVGYNDDGEGAPTVPVFEDCVFENLTLRAEKYGKNGLHEPCEAINLAGFDIPGHFIKNVKFRNVTIDSGESRTQTLLLQCCEGLSLENITVK